MKLAIVGCGKKKKSGKHPAEDLYTSQYFKSKKEYANEKAFTWFVLSAEYGLIQHKEEIESYDTTIKDVDEEEWSKLVEKQFEHFMDFFDSFEEEIEEIIILAGQDYIEPIKPLLKESPYPVSYPFDETNGIGEQLKLLKEGVE